MRNITRDGLNTLRTEIITTSNMVYGTMLTTSKANFLRYDQTQQPPWRAAASDGRDATQATLQVFEQQNGRFLVLVQHLHTKAELLQFVLNEVQYEIKASAWHEITINTQGQNLRFAIQFDGTREGQNFATIIQNSLHEIKRAGTGVPQPGISRPNIGAVPKTQPSIPGRGGVANSGLRTQPDTDFTNIVDDLRQVIASGDVNRAKTLATILAEQRAQLNVSVNPNAPTSRGGGQLSQLMSIRVHIEDKVTSGGCVSLKVKPTSTIAELKREISDKYGFPEQVQQWVIGQRLAKKENTLAGLRVTSGASVFLYLTSPSDVSLSQQDYEAQQLQRLHPSPQIVPIDVPQSQGLQNSQGGAEIGAIGGQLPTQDRVFNNMVATEATRQTRPNQPGLMATHTGVVDYDDNQPTVRRPSAPPPPPPAAQRQQSREVGWTCPICTYLNQPTRPGCEMCGSDRPDDFVVPENYQLSEREKERLNAEARNIELLQQAQRQEEQQRLQQRQVNFMNLMAAEGNELIANVEEFDCPICFMPVDPGEGVILRECLHTFCRECLGEHIVHSEEAAVLCPFQDDVYACQSELTEREIKALVSPANFQKYLQRGLHTAENQAADSYHCKTPDCQGWCYYDDNNNFFPCPICGKQNCLTCKAIHEGLNCKQYQDDLKRRAANDTAAKQTQLMLEKLVTDGEALHCPRCNIVLQKKDGCDWLRCTMCKLEICWVTKGPRWGPDGSGDISGGCKCRVNNKKCHPDCRNCH
ncbi:ranBP-type and C3HC4-type zinc finger-containing protein 1-like isoform X2 [Glandiceps talaboti]